MIQGDVMEVAISSFTNKNSVPLEELCYALSSGEEKKKRILENKNSLFQGCLNIGGQEKN